MHHPALKSIMEHRLKGLPLQPLIAVQHQQLLLLTTRSNLSGSQTLMVEGRPQNQCFYQQEHIRLRPLFKVNVESNPRTTGVTTIQRRRKKR
jgi:hypothetical protein